MYIPSYAILFPAVAAGGGGGITIPVGAGNVTSQDTQSSPVTVTKPTNVASGELLCVVVTGRHGTITNTVGGLTKLTQVSQAYDNGETAFFYKFSDGTETNLTFTSTDVMTATAFRVLGANATPIDDFEGSTSTSTQATSYAEANALTTTNAGSVVINIGACGAPVDSTYTWTTIPGTTINNAPGGNRCMQAISYAPGPGTPGSYSPPAFVINLQLYRHALSVAIKP